MCTQNENTVEFHVLGREFEWYVREYLFIDGRYELLDSPRPFIKDKRHFPQSAMRPDYKLWDRRSKQTFYVEAKYRSWRNNNTDVWCTYPGQLDRYLSYNEEYPTFLILGLGGSPTQPALVTLLPIEEVYPNLFNSQIRKFQIESNQAISTDVLWSAWRRSLIVSPADKVRKFYFVSEMPV